jgi:asparagine synthetase B (glutamine-hydrolysing)
MKTLFKKIKLLPYNKTISLKLDEIDETELEESILEGSVDKFEFPTKYEDMNEEVYENTVKKQAQLFEQYFNILFNKKTENNYFLLSGGLDSRLLFTSVDEELRKKCRGITFDYSERGGNVTNARRVADLLGIEHIVRIIDVEDTIRDTLKHMWWCEGVSTQVSSRLVSFLSEVETSNNLYIDGYVGDGQLGGEFFTCIKNKNLKKDSAHSLLKAMQLHNYFFPPKIFEKLLKEKDILKRVIIPELRKHVDLLWGVEDERMRTETLLAQTRGRKYAVGGPKTVEIYGTTVLPFYHPQIFSNYVKVPYKLREKRNFELDVLGALNEEIASLRTTSSKFKRLKIVQNALKVVRWIEKKLGISVVPKSSSPIYMWTDKESLYYKFINNILEDENCFIWNILNKEGVRKCYDDLFNRKSHLELFLSAFIDLEIVMRLFYGLEKPEKAILESDNLKIKQEVNIQFIPYDLKKEIYS